MYCSEGSHSGTLMYGSEGSCAGTLMYCSEGSQLVVEPCMVVRTYVATGSSTLV